MKTSPQNSMDIGVMDPQTDKAKWYAYGLLALFSIISLVFVMLGRVDNGAYLPITLTIVYAVCLPVWMGMREGLKGTKNQSFKVELGQGVLSNVPASDLAQVGQIAAFLSVTLSTAFVSFTMNSGLSHWCTLIFVTCLVLFPIWVAEILLFRRWGRTPDEAVFRRVMASASVVGFLIGLVGTIAAFIVAEQNNSDWNFAPLFLTPIVYVFYALRYRSVKRWQDVVRNESERADNAVQARQIAEMQLTLLQAQIEPHFLYNTLASVQYLVRNDATSADFLLTQLIRYLRQAMPKMRATMSTLDQEFELADAYLQIARMRMGGRLSVEIELPKYLNGFPFPPLVVQTLVENALKHGVEPKVGQVSVKVSAAIVANQLILCVTDTGVGFGRAAIPGGGTGLTNIRDRLSGIYTGQAHLDVVDIEGGGVQSRVTVSQVEVQFVKGTTE